MPKRKSKGGPRRNKVPEVDAGQLLDRLCSYVKSHGVQAAFSLGKYYKHLQHQHAAVAADLSEQVELFKYLAMCNTDFLFKYSDLKVALKDVLRLYPDVAHKFTLHQQANLCNELPNSLIVLCKHARRLKDQKKFLEACSKATAAQERKLAEIRGLVCGEECLPEAEPEVPASQASVETNELLEEFQIPSAPGKSLAKAAASPAKSLLAEAQKTSPIPVRKAVLREAVAMKKPSGRKRPAACEEPVERAPAKESEKKKKALSADLVVAGQKLQLMPYNSTGACAVRLVGGRQLLQVVSKKGMARSKELAGAILKKLENGATLGSVKAWKAAKLACE